MRIPQFLFRCGAGQRQVLPADLVQVLGAGRAELGVVGVGGVCHGAFSGFNSGGHFNIRTGADCTGNR